MDWFFIVIKSKYFKEFKIFKNSTMLFFMVIKSKEPQKQKKLLLEIYY